MAELTTTPPTTLPPCRRYICSHDVSGKSIFHSSDPLPYYHLGDVGGMSRSYAVSSVPAKLAGDADVKEYLADDGPASHKAMDIVQANHTGANLIVVDLAPGGVSAMHQTVSIDFSVCVIGSIEMELDNGEKVMLAPGVRSCFPCWFSQARLWSEGSREESEGWYC